MSSLCSPSEFVIYETRAAICYLSLTVHHPHCLHCSYPDNLLFSLLEFACVWLLGGLQAPQMKANSVRICKIPMALQMYCPCVKNYFLSRAVFATVMCCMVRTAFIVHCSACVVSNCCCNGAVCGRLRRVKRVNGSIGLFSIKARC